MRTTGRSRGTEERHRPSATAATKASPPSALDQYRESLSRLEVEIQGASPGTAVSRVLICRDQVASALAADQALASEWLPDLLQMDQRLQDQGSDIVQKLGPATFNAWRDTLLPQTSAWWWFLDQRTEAAEQIRHGALLLLAGLAIIFSLTLAADVSTRFLSGGPDQWGYISTAAQVLLTFLAGSAFVTTGRQWLSSFYTQVRLPRRVQSLFSFLLALAVLAVLLALRFSLPWISDKYYERGLDERRELRISDAVDTFHRATALNPDNRLAYYGLGNAYRDLLDYDKAIAEYRRVLELDSRHADANSQLALCFLQKGNDYDQALEIISRVFPVKGRDADSRYAAYKNRAWALWGLKRLELAGRDLGQALAARPAGAEAHALLAQVLDDEGRKPEALAHWLIAAHPAKGDYISTRWLSLAILRSMEGQKQ